MKLDYSQRTLTMGWLGSWIVIWFGCQLSWGQDQQDQSLEQLQQRWTELQIQFASQESAMQLGEGDTKQLLVEYRTMVDQANALVEQLKTKALAELTENPQDSKTLRLIMGILVHEANRGLDREVLAAGQQLISLGIQPVYFEVAAKANRLSITGREMFEELLIRQREAKKDDLPRVRLETTKGNIVVELYEDQAPNTINNFVTLVESGHFSDIQFHRVIDGFMAQAGQNKGDGSPAPELDYTIACECDTPDTRPHFTHCISMALDGKDSGAGQFFLTFSRTKRLDGVHTCFGRIIEGAEVLERIERTASQTDEAISNVEPDRILKAEVLRKRDHDYLPRKLGEKNPALTDKQEQVPDLPATSPDDSTDAALPELPDLPDRSSEAKESSVDGGL